MEARLSFYDAVLAPHAASKLVVARSSSRPVMVAFSIPIAILSLIFCPWQFYIYRRADLALLGEHCIAYPRFHSFPTLHSFAPLPSLSNHNLATAFG